MRLFVRSLIIFIFILPIAFIFGLTFVKNVSASTTTPYKYAVGVVDNISGSWTNIVNFIGPPDGATAQLLNSSGLIFLKYENSFSEIPIDSSIISIDVKATFHGTGQWTVFFKQTDFYQDECKGITLIPQNNITLNDYFVNIPASSCPFLTAARIRNGQFYLHMVRYTGIQSYTVDAVGIRVTYKPSVTLTPTPTPIPTLTPIPKTPLILIPGIGGSELKTTQNTVWLAPDGHGGTFTHVYPVEEKVWVNNIEAIKPGEDDYFDVLKMQEDGQVSQASLALTGSLFDGYQETINFFISNGYALNKDFFLFPYDWRKDIALTAPLLDQKIDEIKAQTGGQKVDIIAHSMGGLVTRNYISDASRAAKVRKLFTLGTPHLGSVKSLKALRYGDCLFLDYGQFCLTISPTEVKDVLQNMISGYELAPSQKYFDFYNNQDKDHLYPYQSNDQSLNYSQIKSLLTSIGYNTSLFIPAESFHNLDNLLSNTNNVEVVNIVGSGLPTLGQIIEKSIKDFFGNTIQKKDGFAINGDKTVPLFSASLNDPGRNLSLLGNVKVFYTKQEHGNLVSSGSALNLVKSIISNDSQLPNGASIVPYSFNGTEISVHSPVNINIYDSSGNHTGSTADGNFEVNIPGSSYDILDDAKFIFLPNDGNYNIEFEATDNGAFDFKIRKYENDENIETVLYNDIPLTENTKAQTSIDASGELPILLVDEDGNETTDFEVGASSVLTGDDIFDQTPPQTTIELSGTAGLNGWYKSDVVVTLNSQDEGNGSGILKTEYSLDNGTTVNIYTDPFTISSEKINKLKFRSIDKAGNEEEPKEIEIKIDKTAPEAKIFVDQNKQDLVVEGIDANSTTIERLYNLATKKKDDAIYIVTDLAGNSLKLDVRERDKNKKDRFRIYSTHYNNDLAKILENNHFNVTYSGKKERANVKEQNFELKGEVKIRIKYDVRKNKSTIIVKEFKKERIKEIRSGLILLQLLTDKGRLKTSY